MELSVSCVTIRKGALGSLRLVSSGLCPWTSSLCFVILLCVLFSVINHSRKYNYMPCPASPLSKSSSCSWRPRTQTCSWDGNHIGGFQSPFLALEYFVYGNPKFRSSDWKGGRGLGPPQIPTYNSIISFYGRRNCSLEWLSDIELVPSGRSVVHALFIRAHS